MGKAIILISLVLAVLASFSIYSLVIKFYVDPYLENYSALNRARMLFEFYNTKIDSDKVYYWGASDIKEDVDASLIDELNSSFRHYNLGNPASTPLIRSAELESAINSKPKSVVMGVGYMSFSEQWLFPYDQYALISEYVNLRGSNLNLVYNKTYKELLNMNRLKLLLYKRKFINAATDKNIELLKHSVLGGKKPDFYKKYNSDFKSEGILLQYNELHDPEFITKLEAKTDFKEYNVPDGINAEKLAFKLMVQKLSKNKIKVIVVKIPLNPSLVKKIPNEYKKNFDAFLDETAQQYNFTVLDYTLRYNESYFYDAHHLNRNGKEIFSKDLGLKVIKMVS
ncbi:hypothetical protein HYW19_02010 [Candidatus Woesearchaeota archaeon]|nr:hypothetical protein [Candidatus Woesearchaeota archaeon]